MARRNCCSKLAFGLLKMTDEGCACPIFRVFPEMVRVS